MVTHVRIGSVENRPALTRLAGKARADGIRLFRDRAGRYFASSASKPGTLHYVTGYSCDCLGFVTHHRCKHHAALMTALGWVEDERGPEPPAPPAMSGTCSECGGTGTISVAHSRWIGSGKLGYRDEWNAPTACPGCGKEEAA